MGRLAPGLAFVLATPMLAFGAAGQVSPPATAPDAARVAAAASKAFQDGSAAVAAGDLKGAHAAFARLVRLVPQVAAAHSAFGSVLLAEGDSHDAVAELSEARRLDPTDVQASINLAVARSRLGEYADSVTLFRGLPATAGTLQPAEVVAYATALAGIGDRAGAEAAVRGGVAANVGSAELWDALGSIEAQDLHFDAAAEDLRKAQHLDPAFAPAHAHLGSVLLLRGDPAGAVAELRQAAQMGDTAPAAEVELGRALSATGDDAAAVAELRKALAAEPGSVETMYALALALQAGGQAKEALPLFVEVIGSRPKDVAALTNYGLALVQTGDAKGALAIYARASAAGPDSPTLRENTGVAYLQTNDIDHALEQFRAGLALDPGSAQMHYDLGLAYKLKDDLPAATAELERAETLDPKLPDPPYTLGVIQMQQGHAAEAAREFQRAVASNPQNGGAWALLGSVEKDAGDPENAAVALRRAMALQPDQPSPHITLAAILAAKGDAAGALAERKMAAALSRSAMSRQRASFALESGRTLLARGQVADAVVQLNDAVAAEPNLKEAHLLLAEALEKQGRPADALAERRKAEQLAQP